MSNSPTKPDESRVAQALSRSDSYKIVLQDLIHAPSDAKILAAQVRWQESTSTMFEKAIARSGQNLENCLGCGELVVIDREGLAKCVECAKESK